MFKTRDITYVHTSKTGGQFVRHILNSIYPSYTPLKYHLTLEEHNPSNHIISTIRNPFDWYVSVFLFYHKIEHPVVSGLAYDFEGTVRALLTIRPERLRNLIKYPWKNNCPQPNLSAKDFENYPPNTGYCSFTFNRMTGLRKDVEFMRFETLTEDLIKVLKQYSHITPAQEGLIRSTPCINTTKHKHYRSYYSTELVDLVYEKEKDIFDRFHYEF